MKNRKRFFALLIAVVMAFGMSMTAFAQTVPAGAAQQDGKAKITIENASKGETYKIAKLFDASVTGTAGGSVRYEGDIPDDLSTYFTKDTAGNISATDALDLEDADVQAALKTWAEANVTAQAVSDGSALDFVNLDFGYYIVTTTQGQGLITVNTTNPFATLKDKNTTPPVNNLVKKVDDEDKIVSIGDEITYTVSFNTSNYDGEDQITKYVISDTLPAFLTLGGNAVQSIIIDDDGDTATTDDQHDVTAQFTTDKTITIAWTSGTTSLYKNGALLTIVYKATVNDQIAAGNVDTNKNTVTIDPYAGDKKVEVDDNTDDETIQTYAAALQKKDENGNKLAGATFQVPGLTVDGEAGNYTVTSYDPTSTTAGTTMECDSDGFLVIRGLSNETAITIYEVDAPDGYNKLVEGKTLPVIATSTTTTTTATTSTTTTYYDADGNVVDQEVDGGSSTTTTTTTLATNEDLIAGQLEIVNQKGATMPETGGIGTTIFYAVGAVLVIGAGVVMITRRRMSE